MGPTAPDDSRDDEGDSAQSQVELFEQYKLYVEMADRVSQRRALANTFFLTLHTGIFGLAMGLAGFSDGRTEYLAASLAAVAFGIPFAYVWRRILTSYNQLNRAKYSVIQELEERLPVSLYRLEWEKLGKGANPKLYTELSSVEGWVPTVFTLGYLVGVALSVFLLLED